MRDLFYIMFSFAAALWIALFVLGINVLAVMALWEVWKWLVT